MSSEDLKAGYLRSTETVWNAHSLESLDEDFAPDVISHVSGQPEVHGLAAYKQRLSETWAIFPDFHVTADEVIVEGSTVVARWTARATYLGPSPTIPVPPTGKQAIFKGTWVGHFNEDKCVEDWYTYDTLDFLQQIGAFPPMDEAAR
jgi:predicted ester cyclase